MERRGIGRDSRGTRIRTGSHLLTSKRKIKRLLIANRGEIALRIIRACKELDITAVSVYSEVDRTLLHVLKADEAYPLTGSTPRESYLNQHRIIEIARNASVDAIHPGYGFLAENPDFADAVTQSGMIFVGPTGDAIRAMGDKTSARKMAQHLGIPTIGGSTEPISNTKDALKIAADIGYPVLLKAAAGGGGKGMRVVQGASEFDAAFRIAQSEAKGAFGDDRVYLEKYLDSPRHIEMQILADGYGNVVYLGERECSIQRRHQKVIEESPSTAVNEQLRRELGDSAVRLAKAAGYSNAGTLEFLLDQSGKIYFLEMNTRLQVEHPVTEAVTGIDLVKEQIRIAEGEPLAFHQDEIRRTGHALECRICAEDPLDSFMPSMGRLSQYQLPEGHVRIENGFRQGDEISVFYDSLMAKVISWGEKRQDAIASMKRALSDFNIDGVRSTIPFCLFVLRHQAFVNGDISTRFIDQYFSPTAMNLDSSDKTLAAAVSAVLIATRGGANSIDQAAVTSPEGKWRNGRREFLR